MWPGFHWEDRIAWDLRAPKRVSVSRAILRYFYTDHDMRSFLANDFFPFPNAPKLGSPNRYRPDCPNQNSYMCVCVCVCVCV